MGYRSVDYKDENIGEIAKRIKMLRELSNESQEELAKAINATKYTIANIEQGKTSLTLDNARLIGIHYNVSIDWICGRVENMDIPSELVDTLCRYIKISTNTLKMKQMHKIPFISIQNNLFDYLNVLDRAEQLKKDNVPDEVIEAWLEKKKGETLAFFQNVKNESFVEYALLSQRDIASDEVMEIIENTYRESR